MAVDVGATAVRVLVDGRELTGMGRFSGLGTFTRNLVGALAEIDSLSMRVLTTDTSVVPEGVQPVRMWRRFDARRRAMYEHEALISLDVLRCRCDVVYSPAISGVPYAHRPYVQTLHDVIPLVVPHPHFAHLRKWWSRWGRRYRRADAVVAVSRYTADEGMRLLGLDPARIHVAHNGVHPQFCPRPDGDPDDPPYILVVSEYAPHKGFGDAFATIGALAGQGYPHRLKVAGRVQDVFRDQIDDLLHHAPMPDRIDLLGFVEDLPELYRGATAFICCSRYEGFGLPVVEAMASGVPVAAYSNSSLTEVVSGAGVLVPDGDVSAMVGAVRSILDDQARRAELREAGLERVRRFSWDGCATVYADVFSNVAGS
jgi:glycosyltransferase involved in cell wall biosynthesis